MDVRNLSSVLGGLFISAALTACSESDSAPRAVEQPDPLFMLSADGVGPLNAETPFNLRQIGDAFQDYNVAEETHFLNGSKYPMITVKQQADPLLSINPDHQGQNVFSIVVHNNRVGNKLGHQVGEAFNKIYSYEKTEECAPGVEEWEGKVMCYAPQNKNILYLFASAQGGIENVMRTAENIVPPPETMADWVLEAIIWKPPGR